MTFIIGEFPAFFIQPNDFSSNVVNPPTIFPGVGLSKRLSSPVSTILSSYVFTNSTI
jgi:hypothetical protein